MRLQAIAAAAALSLAMGSAFAQTTSSNNVGGQATDPIFQNELENKMYEDREMMGGFFTDETFATLRPTEELRTYWGELDAEQQAGLKANCNQAIGGTADFSPGTVALCDQIRTF